MTDRIFEMLRKDNTRYIVNGEKLNEIERLTTAQQLILTKITTGRTLNPCYTCFDVMDRHHRELLDMQWLLMVVQTVKFTLNQEAVTVSEIFEDFEKYNDPLSEQVKKLIVTAQKRMRKNESKHN